MVQDLGHFGFLAQDRKMEYQWSIVGIDHYGRRKKAQRKTERSHDCLSGILGL